MQKLAGLLVALARLAEAELLLALGVDLLEDGVEGVGGEVVEAEAAEEAVAPLLDDPDGGADEGGAAALDELAGAQGDGREEGVDVVGGLGAEVRVQGRVEQVEAEEEVVYHDLGRHDPVFHGPDERQLEHRLGLLDVAVEDSRGVDYEDALADVEGVGVAAAPVRGVVIERGGGRGRGGDDAHGLAHLARDADLGARARGLGGVLHASVAEGVEERRLAGVGQADDEGAEAEDGVVGGGAGLEDVDEARDGPRVLDVGEEHVGRLGRPRRVHLVPGALPPREQLLGLGGPRLLGRREMRLGVHDDALARRQRRLEDPAARRQGHAAVAALDDEPDVREHLAHLVERLAVVADEVGLGDLPRDLEDLARDEPLLLLRRSRSCRRRRLRWRLC